jgi:PleD family two-component response regulator
MNPYISILIADDDSDEAAFLNEGIAQVISAYKVFNAADGAQCMRFLKTNPAPELIFLDLNMPLRSGTECLKAIRETSSLDKTPVIIYSASHNYRDIDKCYKLGANFYMVKPVTLTAMVSLLDQLFVALGKPKRDVKSKEKFVLMGKPELISVK